MTEEIGRKRGEAGMPVDTSVIGLRRPKNDKAG